ncbi:MAG: metallophosphoesterase [Opitutales bacterium]|nr:metallophosphoesterase [Opitutales bacterium]
MSLPAPSQGVVEPLRERLGPYAWARRLRIESGAPLKAAVTLGERILHATPVYPALVAALTASGLMPRARREFAAMRIERTTVFLPNLPPSFDGFRILQISDLHLDVDWTVAARVTGLLPSLDYDIAVFTGDIIDRPTNYCPRVVGTMEEILSNIAAPAYGILGNHDRLNLVPPLENLGLRFLLNEGTALRRDGDVLWLAGVDDPAVFRCDDAARARAQAPGGTCTVLLAHAPNIARRAAARGADLTLSGHTHGGQICLPGGWGRTGGREISGDQRAGFWFRHGTPGYTCRGAGGSHLPVRLNCPPQLSLHTLFRGTGAPFIEQPVPVSAVTPPAPPCP